MCVCKRVRESTREKDCVCACVHVCVSICTRVYVCVLEFIKERGARGAAKHHKGCQNSRLKFLYSGWPQRHGPEGPTVRTWHSCLSHSHCYTHRVAPLPCHARQRHRPLLSLLYVTWLIYMWHDSSIGDVTLSYVTHSYMTWHIHRSHIMTQSYVTWLNHLWRDSVTTRIEWLLFFKMDICWACLKDSFPLRYEWVMSHMNESCPIWMSHVCIAARCCVNEWVLSHVNVSCSTWMSHVPCDWVMSHMNEYYLI